MGKKIVRLHPAVAVAGILSLASMAIAAELVGNSAGEALKIGAAAVTAGVLGFKLSGKIPLI